MNAIRKTFLLATLTLSFLVGKTINLDNFDTRLANSYRTGQLNEWQGVIGDLTKLYTQTNDLGILFKIAQTQYGYIGFLIGTGKTSEARRYLKMAENNVENILAKRPNCHDALAIQSSLYAFHIALSPYKAPVFGPRSLMIIDEAYKINNASPQVLIEKGNVAHYAPALFGGNLLKAIDYYTLAIEKLQTGGQPTWILLNTLVQRAMVYDKAGMKTEAKNAYRQILTLAPDFKWVRDELYPQFLTSN